MLLLALAAPVVALRAGIPDDGALPASRTERQAYDLVAQGFGPGQQRPGGGRRRHSPAIQAVVDPLVEALRADPRDRLGRCPEVYAGAGVAVVVAIPDDGATGCRHARRRSSGCAPRCCPARSPAAPRRHTSVVRRRTSPTSAHASTNGCPVLIAAVLAMSFVLLMLVFRSVLVPLKAVRPQPAQHRCGVRRAWSWCSSGAGPAG